MWTAFRCGILLLTALTSGAPDGDGGQPTISPRIVRGEEAPPYQHTHVVSLESDRAASAATTSWTFTCGGSMLDSQWVLTAAHCCDGGDDASYIDGRVQPERYRVGIFQHNRGASTHPCSEHIQAARVIVHPRYGFDTTKSGDLALIKLQTPARCNLPRSRHMPSA